MTLSEKILNYYGSLGDEEKKFIDSFEDKISEEDKEKLFKEIITKKSKRFSAPDVAFLNSVFVSKSAKKESLYYWAVCVECNGEYCYTLPFCPHCWAKGFICSTKAVKTSEFKPPISVARFNKEYTCGAEKGNFSPERICYDCKNKEFSYCYFFGSTTKTNIKKNCETCKCKECCQIAQIANAKWNMAQSQKKTTSFAVPFRKIF